MEEMAACGVWYESGSQKYKGKIADSCTSLWFCMVRILLERSAMFRLPANPYKTAMAVRKTIEARKFSVKYFTAPSICTFFPPSVIKTKEEIMITSNHTYKLKI